MVSDQASDGRFGELAFDSHSEKLRQLAREAARVKERDQRYFTTRRVREDRNFLIACRHWNSSTPVIPRRFSEMLPYPRLAGYGFGGGYFLVLNGVGVVVDPGYGFVQVLYSSYGYTICDIDAVFVTHDHPDHWADLANILVLKHTASRYPGSPSREPKLYLNRTVSQLRHFLLSTEQMCNTISHGEVVRINRSDGQEAAKATAMRGFHCERLRPNSNSPNVIGLHFEVAQLRKDRPGLRNIAIAGDTQFPSVRKLNQGLREFTEHDVAEFAKEYDAGRPGIEGCPRGDRKIDVLAMHIGSVEPKIRDMPDQNTLKYIKNEVFYEGYHLGFAGCLKMLDLVFRNDQANKLALLTEFGEELRGYRVDLARALEGATEANSEGHPNVRVLPADIGMAVQLTWDEHRKKRPGAMLRCSKCFRMKELKAYRDRKPFDFMDPEVFHPVSDMLAFEDLDTGLIQYCCGW
jgi:hypothetical protein